jgi:hypothetical protein
MEFDKYNMEGNKPEMPMESLDTPAPTGLMAKQETV